MGVDLNDPGCGIRRGAVVLDRRRNSPSGKLAFAAWCWRLPLRQFRDTRLNHKQVVEWIEGKNGLWNTRNKAVTDLEGSLKLEAEVLSEAFDLLDECIARLEIEHDSEPYSRVCGLTLIKGRNLLLGSYSLSIDGLAQEAGALLRPFIEAFEKMIYFNEDPERIASSSFKRLVFGAVTTKGGFSTTKRRIPYWIFFGVGKSMDQVGLLIRNYLFAE